MPAGLLFAVGTTYSVNAPEVVTLATLFPMLSVNQRLPSGPAVIPKGALLAVGTANSVAVPEGVMRPILLAADSVNHTIPSGPIPTNAWFGRLAFGVGIGNSLRGSEEEGVAEEAASAVAVIEFLWSVVPC